MLTPSDNPEVTLELPKLTTSSVAHPDTWNPTHQALLDNDAALSQRVGGLAQEFEQAQNETDDKINQLQSLDAPQLAAAVRLDWLYSGNKTALELWSGEHSMMGAQPEPIISAIAGDDSVDVEDSAQFRPGQSYIIHDAAHTEQVVIDAVLTSSRIRLVDNLQHSYGAGAHLSSTSFNVDGAAATAKDGDIYLTDALTTEGALAPRAVVIRRQSSDAVIAVDYRALDGSWRKAPLAWTRSGGKIPAGFCDCEYEFTHQGETALRVSVTDGTVEILHIAMLGSPTGLRGQHTPPLKPAMANPINGATGLTDRPTFALTKYESPTNTPVAAAQFQVSETDDFADAIINSGSVYGGLSWRESGLRLETSSTYFVRGRAQDAEGAWSPWSDSVQFETAESFVYVQAPTNIGPVNNAENVSDTPALSVSSFAVYAGEDSHAATQWQIRAASSTYADAILDIESADEALSELLVPAELLESGQQQYFWRARQKGASIGWSDWSVETRFTTKKTFGTVIGIALVTTGGSSGHWVRVDEDGNGAANADPAFFAAHPTYAGIVDELIDSQHMRKFPAFYEKNGFLESGAYAGKFAIFISDKKEVGFELDPGFMHEGEALQQFWLGKYTASNGTGNVMQSMPGTSPLVSINFPAMASRAEARNKDGVEGFQLWNVHMLSAVKKLALIKLGNPDVQALIAPGHSSGSSAQAVDSEANLAASCLGLVGLWGNVWEMVDGLQIGADMRYRVWDRGGNKEYVQTSQLAPVASGSYIASMSTAHGEGYNLGAMFLPAAVDPSVNNGTYADGFWSAANAVAYHGGGWDGGALGGLFCLYVSRAASSSRAGVGGRLAKV